ncbi:MAG: HAD-IIIA family hydrolase [Lachnospiraceae bacterium]|nr:HAD-IIIA family hydrolase [Lachnospiraceae bacterium]
MIFDDLIPTYIAESTYNIDYKDFYEKGFRAIIFDIDNTLVLHDRKANESAELLVYMLHRIGYKVLVLSNNGHDRVKDFCEKCKVDYYIENASKPSAKNFHKIIKMASVNESEVLCIGDQIFTDIWGANNAKLTSVLVNPLGKETKYFITIKRFFENIVKMIRKKDFDKRVLK